MKLPENFREGTFAYLFELLERAGGTIKGWEQYYTPVENDEDSAPLRLMNAIENEFTNAPSLETDEQFYATSERVQELMIDEPVFLCHEGRELFQGLVAMQDYSEELFHEFADKQKKE